MRDSPKLKVAIVCDWLTGYGGAERVVLELHNIFPSAPIYTSQYDPKKIDWFKNADVRTTWLQKLPKVLRKMLPVFRAWSFSRIKLEGYDLIISTSGAEAKFVKVKKPAVHINYCHSPTHYYWIRYEEYLKNPGWGIFNWLGRFGLKVLVGPMRRWDYRAAQRPDLFIANSNFTKENIKKYYKRNSIVIFPPVDVDRFSGHSKSERSGYVTAGRQVPYMRKDLAVAACTKLNLPLTVIGEGPEHSKLVKIAGPSIKFLAGVSDKEMPDHFRNARAFLFPGKEDFGIVAVEAMAAGTPVIAYKAGGALDSVDPKKSGMFFEKQTVDSLSKALIEFENTNMSSSIVSAHSRQFDIENFRKKILSVVQQINKTK